MNASLSDIAKIVNGVVKGDASILIHSLAPIDNVTPQSLIFAEGADNIKLAETSEAAAVLVGTQIESMQKPVIQVANPFKAFMQLLEHFYPPHPAVIGIHPSSFIAEDVFIGKQVSIGPFVAIQSGSKIGDHCVIKSHVAIGHNVSIGAHTSLHPHVAIYDNTKIGDRVTIHAHAVIGSDGFGYLYEQGKHQKIPHVGSVVIENDVEIGASTMIDRATLGHTSIGEGTKIDNLVQIAHSVKLGKHNILCAFTGIAGSTKSGNHVTFAANVGVSDHVKIDDGVILGARTGVPPKKHLRQGNIYLGNPARPKDKAIEQELAVTRIPFMRKNIQALSEKVAQLSEKIAQIVIKDSKE
ncbi:MAG: UDP-3-O-(3-hydroxymyristoyl)glucosamine N-acyltransferase [Legionellales bacterium]|jgi:UDP-3-O-[3-hydroxymyristoyl] glucosamine N-acyltransferase|nr:UDP-3-O-(3-hydroxymyristoyl)glucosamine N-acyltransferase [Legionellales bacterium]